MKINQAGLNLIKEFEGLRLRAYQDLVGVLTIGWGHTGEDVYSGQIIDEAEAEELLKDDLCQFEAGVSKLLEVPINENQFAALVCFAYNVGIANLKRSTLLRCINKHNIEGAAGEFLRWNKAAGREIAGLTRRREAEKALFIRPSI